MKKLLLILLCLPMIGLGQTFNSFGCPSSSVNVFGFYSASYCTNDTVWFDLSNEIDFSNYTGLELQTEEWNVFDYDGDFLNINDMESGSFYFHLEDSVAVGSYVYIGLMNDGIVCEWDTLNLNNICCPGYICDEVETYTCLDDACIDPEDGSGFYSTIEACEASCELTVNPSWNCLNDACIDPEDGSGFYSTIEACEASCEVTVNPSWNCLNDACIDPEDGSGFYSSISECEDVCATSSLTEPNKAYKKLIKITNLLGQEIPIRNNTPMIYIYDDGTVEKKIIIE